MYTETLFSFKMQGYLNVKTKQKDMFSNQSS